jgi:hypothetical protein
MECGDPVYDIHGISPCLSFDDGKGGDDWTVGA